MQVKAIKSNQTELRLNDYVILVSYSTPVAYYDRKTGEYFKTSKKWSRTTSKHVTQWLQGVDAKEVDQEKIDNLLNK